MMRAAVSGNAIEISFSRAEMALLALSVMLAGVLFVWAGWQVTVVALGLSLIGAGAVDLVQQSDIEILGR